MSLPFSFLAGVLYLESFLLLFLLQSVYPAERFFRSLHSMNGFSLQGPKGTSFTLFAFLSYFCLESFSEMWTCSSEFELTADKMGKLLSHVKLVTAQWNFLFTILVLIFYLIIERLLCLLSVLPSLPSQTGVKRARERFERQFKEINCLKKERDQLKAQMDVLLKLL